MDTSRYAKVSSYEQAVKELSEQELKDIFGSGSAEALRGVGAGWSAKQWDYCSNGCPTHCQGWRTYKK